jgi:hypothetical protein
VVELPSAALIVASVLLLWVVLSAEFVAEHTGVPIPPIVRHPVRRGRANLIIEIPLALFLLGGGQAAIAIMAFHPASSVAVRLLAIGELAISIAWVLRLVQLWRADHL